MIEELIGDHKMAARSARWTAVARSTVDASTEDILTQRLSAHEKDCVDAQKLVAGRKLGDYVSTG
jgi:hypothetical protein